MKNLLINGGLIALWIMCSNAEDRLPDRKRIPANWISFHEGVFSACKCIQIIDYSSFSDPKKSFYECSKETSLIDARKWIVSNLGGLLNSVPSEPVGNQGATRPRFVMRAYSTTNADDDSLMFEIVLTGVVKGFDRAEYEDLVTKWGALPYE